MNKIALFLALLFVTSRAWATPTYPTVKVVTTDGASTIPVSGDFYPATQPVSGSLGRTWSLLNSTDSVNAVQSGAWSFTLLNSSVPVTGTFWQATQPVSGTFWQVTQPVSIATMPSTPVTGTFWQATQPVSGTFFQATQPVSIAGSNPCYYPGATLVSITGATSTTNATQIIALSGTTKIYICSLTVVGVSGTTPTFSLVQGTGSNCVTGQTTVVQAFGTTANQLYQFATPVAVGTAGAELCYKDGGTSPVENYQITYVQQ